MCTHTHTHTTCGGWKERMDGEQVEFGRVILRRACVRPLLNLPPIRAYAT